MTSSHVERIKIMKLLWDAVGTEFAGRHELYERNYSGGWEDIRAQVLTGARAGRRPEGDGGAGRSVHGRLRRERLDRRNLGRFGRLIRNDRDCAECRDEAIWSKCEYAHRRVPTRYCKQRLRSA